MGHASPVAGHDDANSLDAPQGRLKYLPSAGVTPPPPPPPVANEAECEVLVGGKEADGSKKIDVLALDDPEYREYVPLLLAALHRIARDTPTVELEARITYLSDCLQRLPQ